MDPFAHAMRPDRTFRSFVTVYATEYFTDYECCVGWNRINDTCQADCHFPCHHGLCVETNVCECDDGWEGAQCEHEIPDIDECARGDSGCAQNCHNTHGSYFCTCDAWYSLAADEHNCTDINECVTN
ncbi:epidermal growth factor-like protein 7 [Branchiostoma floridae]|uniref:Epidermal growth factor-like protein 7 n=1 Tax=Branchiostoma floridae TaxID=7739 RepID=A0A9J7LT70_BRAFL|nr:epidermal growth factor-like protein 7 [Branchiostoma floridae]